MTKPSKIHKRTFENDYRNMGQTDWEYEHTTKCGYTRENVTTKDSEVTCKLCLREMKKDD